MRRMQMLTLSLLFCATLILGMASSAMALTEACTEVTNQATLSYSVGGIAQTDIDSDDPTKGGSDDVTSFFVDTKVDLTMTVAQPEVDAWGNGHVLSFEIENLGNDYHDYVFELYNAATGEKYDDSVVDDFDMSNVTVYHDVNEDGALDGGDADLSFSTFGSKFGRVYNVAGLGNVAGDDNTFNIIVVADLPAGRSPNEEAVYGLKVFTYQHDTDLGTDGGAATETGNTADDGNTANSCGEDVVLGDGDADGVYSEQTVNGLGDGDEDGDFYALAYYKVITSNVSVSKRVSVFWDPINDATDPQYIPGAYVTYNVMVLNSGDAPATLSTMVDDLAAQLAIDSDFITTSGPGNATSAANDAFLVQHNSGRATSVAGDQYYTIGNDNDGVDHDGSATGGTIDADYTKVLPAEDGYAAGELQKDEWVKLFFRAIIQ